MNSTEIEDLIESISILTDVVEEKYGNEIGNFVISKFGVRDTHELTPSDLIHLLFVLKQYAL